MSSYPPSYPSPWQPAEVVVHPRSSTAHLVAAWVVTVVTLAYMLPWAIAATRSHKDVTAIALVNLFLGWSGVGWIVSLVWALSNPYGPGQTVMINNPYASAPPAPHYATQPRYAIEPRGVEPTVIEPDATQPYPASSADEWQPAPWDRPSGTHA